MEYGEIKYDLVGEIAKNTKLLRKTIINILRGISEEKFNMFKINPEDFILKVSNLIDNEKATTLINDIKYNLTDETYDMDIFTINNFKGKLDEDIFEVKRHIYNYLKVDSNIEKNFAKNGLEIGENIVVYAKLPNKFKIKTPIGNYNPDWAIVFNKNEKKHIFFIAETKGSMDSMELRGKEKLRIDYAKKYFETLNDYFKEKGKKINYDVIDSYKNLVNIIQSKEI